MCLATASNGYSRTQNYDGLGRLVSASTTIDTNYTAGATYDTATGQLNQIGVGAGNVRIMV